MSDERQAWAVPVVEQYHALLEVSESIAAHRDLPTLFRDLAQRLPRIAPFDFIGLVLNNPDNGKMRVHVLESAAADRLTSRLDGLELPIEESASGRGWTHQEPPGDPKPAGGTSLQHGYGGARRDRHTISLLIPVDEPPCTGTARSVWKAFSPMLSALGETHWVIGGPIGAAAKLDMKRTTLQTKMHELGIARPR